MKKVSWKRKVLLGTLEATTLIAPLIIVSAVACFSEKKPIDKSEIILNTKPVNGTLFLNQDENLPILSVEAKVDNQNTELAYQWYESDSNSTTNGKIIPGATQSTYTIPKSYTQKTGTKYFYAVVSVLSNNTISSSKISNIYTIKIANQLPTINLSMQSKGQMVIVNQINDLPTFSVDATTNNSNQHLNYQWYSSATNSNTNGSQINGANESSYTVTKMDVSSEGQKYFYVKVTGSINGVALVPVVSNPIPLTVNALPKITIQTQAQNQVAVAGQTTDLPRFSVDATTNNSNQHLNYQWYSSATNSNTNGSQINGANESSYAVTKMDVSSEGQKYFYVKVTGSINGVALVPVVSNPIPLTVNALPKITIQTQPQNQVAVAGQTTDLPTFSVAVNNVEGVQLRYQWYWSTTNPKDPWYLIDGATSSSYKVKPSDVSVSGIIKHYYVRVNGSINKVPLVRVDSSVATLRVNALPKIVIKTNPTDKKVSVGTTLLPEFSVSINKIEGAQLRYQWYWTPHTNYGNKNWQLINGATSPSYIVPSQNLLVPAEMRDYRVKVSGSLNGVELAPVYSNTATLTVNPLPTITISDNPKNQVFVIGKSPNKPTFYVSVKSSDPTVELKYQWYETWTESSNGCQVIEGATAWSYTPKNHVLMRPGIKYYYVRITGVFEGKELKPIYSDPAKLTIKRHSTF